MLAQDHGLRVLLVDSDPQSSLTSPCGVGGAEGRSLAEVLGGAEPGTLALADIVRDIAPGLALAPSDIALARCELALATRLGRESVLKRALATVAGQYDAVLIDTPPSLGLLTIGALVAAEAVLIPVVPEILGLRGLRLFLGALDQVRQAINPELQTLGIVVTFLDTRLRHHGDAVATMRAAGLPVLDVTIGRSVRVAEAAVVGQSVVTFAPRNKRALEFRALGKVVNRWLKAQR